MSRTYDDLAIEMYLGYFLEVDPMLITLVQHKKKGDVIKIRDRSIQLPRKFQYTDVDEYIQWIKNILTSDYPELFL